MAKRARQLRLDLLGPQHPWTQLEEEAKQRCLTLLKQLVQEVWRHQVALGEELDHDG